MRQLPLKSTVVLLCALGCGSGGEKTPAPNMSAAPPIPGQPAPGMGLPPPAGAAGSAAPPVTGPGVVMTPPAGMTPGTAPPSAEEMDSPADEKPAETDPCKGFIVSRSRPCSNDPNPCDIDSGFPGDEYCIPPPAPDEGVQVHFGPKSYTDPAEIDEYEIAPGDEFNQYALAHVPTTEDRFYNRVVYSMRPGSHHLINSLVEGHPTEGFQGPGGCPGTTVGSLGGTQNLIYDSRPNGIVPPENEGLGYTLPANSSICFNYHRYNVTDEPALSEIWVNFYFIDEAEVTQRASWGAIIGGLGMSIAPGEKKTLTYSYTFSGIDEASENPARIIQLFGHRHAATERFAAWLNDELVYDSWNWMESTAFNYDSLTENPLPDPDKMTDGAVNGILEVENGDVLKYSCQINNTTMNTLRFANELYTGEMCNLFGQAVGTRFFGTNF